MKGNCFVIVCLLFVEGCHSDDNPGLAGYVGQGTRWKFSHYCGVEKWSGVDECDARVFMLTLSCILQNYAPLSQGAL